MNKNKIMEWISVKDRIPENYNYVLVMSNKWNGIIVCWFGNMGFIDDSQDINEYVTHWMPLPEPPKDE